MRLQEYIQIHPRNCRGQVVSRLAKACGVTDQAVRHWCNGTRGIPAKHVMTLVEATDGAVSIQDLLKPEAA
jgi:DNA-binding transcriptional regulator YdaS (Cro superfamily)